MPYFSPETGMFKQGAREQVASMLGERLIERSLECPVIIQHWMAGYLTQSCVKELCCERVSSGLKDAIRRIFFDKKIAQVIGGYRHCSVLTYQLIRRCAWALTQLEQSGRQAAHAHSTQAIISTVPNQDEEVPALFLTAQQMTLAQRFNELVGMKATAWIDVFVHIQGNAFGKAIEFIGGQRSHVRADAVSQVVVDAFISAVARLLPLGRTTQRGAERVVAQHLYYCFATMYGREWRRMQRKESSQSMVLAAPTQALTV